jgi:hypothetical protein
MREVNEELWLEYRSHTNSEDAWQFKEWLIKQEPKQAPTYNEEEVEFIKRAVQQ